MLCALNSSALRLAQLVALAGMLALTPASAQPAHAAYDAAWTRAYSGPYTTTKGDIKWDPRFLPLLRASLPQHQWFWRDHARFTPVPELAQLFLGVPGGVLLDDNRFVTASGCVPHACETRGMLWIDTAAHPAQLIFVAQGDVSYEPSYKGPDTLLWVFSSSTRNWQHLPEPFLHSLQRWNAQLPDNDRAEGHGSQDDGGYTVVNLVQPTGQIVTLTPSLLGLEPRSAGSGPSNSSATEPPASGAPQKSNGGKQGGQYRIRHGRVG